MVHLPGLKHTIHNKLDLGQVYNTQTRCKSHKIPLKCYVFISGHHNLQSDEFAIFCTTPPSVNILNYEKTFWGSCILKKQQH